MPAKSSRKIVRIGSSSFITLPIDWVRGMGLKEGDEVEILYDSIILILPKKIALDMSFIIRELDVMEGALKA